MELISNEGYKSVKSIFMNKCLACHAWPSTYEETVTPDKIVPFKPEESKIYLNIKDDTMPMSGEKLTPGEKELVRAWIENGATDSENPIISRISKDKAPDTKQTDEEQKQSQGPRLPGSVVLHSISGFTSTGLFLAAGIVSTVHFLSIMNQGHALEEAGIANETNRDYYMMQLWNDPAQQTLRWWHVGLLVSGEGLYLYNAITGIGMWSKDQPGVTREKMHRWLFFVHGSLMIAQIALGFAETGALQTGNHDIHVGVGVAHSVIGFAIPAVMLIAGIENIWR
jgi:hypothetical protein